MLLIARILCGRESQNNPGEVIDLGRPEKDKKEPAEKDKKQVPAEKECLTCGVLGDYMGAGGTVGPPSPGARKMR